MLVTVLIAAQFVTRARRGTVADSALRLTDWIVSNHYSIDTDITRVNRTAVGYRPSVAPLPRHEEIILPYFSRDGTKFPGFGHAVQKIADIFAEAVRTACQQAR